MSIISNVLFFVYLVTMVELARRVDVTSTQWTMPKVAVELIYTVLIVFWPIMLPVGYLLQWHDDRERPS
jgi:hypothetical protein